MVGAAFFITKSIEKFSMESKYSKMILTYWKSVSGAEIPPGVSQAKFRRVYQKMGHYSNSLTLWLRLSRKRVRAY